MLTLRPLQGYRVTRNVPLPYTTTPSAAALPHDDDGLEEAPGAFKARTFAFFHNLHRGLVKDFAPLASIHLLVLGRGTGPKADARRAKEKELKRRRKRSQGTGGDSSDEEEPNDAGTGGEEMEDEDDHEVDGGHPREGAHEREERAREEAEDEEEDDDDDSDDEDDIKDVKKALGDADRMMETSAEGVRATAGMDHAELALTPGSGHELT